MNFKGTKKRLIPTVVYGCLDSLGGVSNAFTDRDVTAYYIKVVPEDLPAAAELLRDLVINSQILKRELTAERGVVTAEISGYNDNPEMRNGNALERLTFAGSELDHNLDHDIVGTAATVGGMTNDDLIKFRNRYYCGANISVFVGGAIPPRLVSGCLVPLFASIDSGRPSSNERFEANRSRMPAIISELRAGDQLNVGLAFPIESPQTTRDQLQLSLLSLLLGGSWSSLLNNELRDRLGCSYGVNSGFEAFEDCGILQVCAGIDPARYLLALERILKIIKQVKKGIDPKIFEAHKDIHCRQLVLSEESTTIYVYDSAMLFVRGCELMSSEQKVDYIRSISLAEFTEHVGALLDFRLLNLSLLGPNVDLAASRQLIESFI